MVKIPIYWQYFIEREETFGELGTYVLELGELWESWGRGKPTEKSVRDEGCMKSLH